MTIESTINAALLASPSFKGIAVRPGFVEESDVPPYVVYQKIHEQRPSDLQGDSGISNAHFQIDVYATTNLQATALRDAARVALLASPSLNAVMTAATSSFDMPTRLFREMQDFSMWFYS